MTKGRKYIRGLANNPAAKVFICHLLFGMLLIAVIFNLLAVSDASATETVYTKSYTYDPNGNIETRTTPNGATITYAYDAVNRLVGITYPNGTVSFAYDANGNRTSMTDSHGTTYYGYDRFNKLRAVQHLGIIPIYYDYDKSGNLTKITYPSGETASYAYDMSNRLTSVTDVTGTTTYEYNNVTNTLLTKTLSNGVITTYTYDEALRIKTVVNKKSDQSLISSYEYTYDKNSNRTQVVETTPSGTKTIDYTYDNLNRLTRASYSDGTYEAYTYDSSGNRLTKTTQEGSTITSVTYEYDKDNRLLKAGNTLFFYDKSGNLKKKINGNVTAEYVYNDENRLTRYTDGTNTVDFEYDGDGNRVSKTVNGVEVKYINDVLSPIVQVLLETNASDSVTARYTYASRSRLNQTNYGATSYYLYGNPGKSVTEVVNQAQTVLNDYEYDAFGNIKDEDETTLNSFKYTGEQYDDETGLVYLRNRYYDPETGRFISKDPFPGYVSNPQTKNPYPYVANNPINRVDPLGLDTEWDDGQFNDSDESLSWSAALSHYVLGKGEALRVPIKDVYPEGGLKPSDFSGPNNTVVIDTNGPAGNVTFYLKNGEIGVYPDRFDFDPKPLGVRDSGGFPYLKETSTRVGSWLPGTPYDIEFEGKIQCP